MEKEMDFSDARIIRRANDEKAVGGIGNYSNNDRCH